MRGVRAQTTLSGPCTVTGRGYWSGEVNTLTFLPAPAGTGIRFVRTDLPGRPSVQATAEYRISMPLRTRLSDGRCEVDMVEHVMAALSGLRIDNAEVHCTAAEMPGMDGSSLAFVLALDGIGKVSLRAKRDALIIHEPFTIQGERGIVSVEPSKSGQFEVEYQLDYGPSSPIGQATFASHVTEDDFYHSIAPARTFISQEEAAALQRKGIAKHVTNRDLIVFSAKGPIDNSLRFTDECARHKALDLIGDLALTGVDLVGRVIARQSGHQLNGQVAERLRDTFYDQRGWARAA